MTDPVADGALTIYREWTESGHSWSGWPGAWCLDCGVSDPMEIAIGEDWYDPYTAEWTCSPETKQKVLRQAVVCQAPGLGAWNPYRKS